MLLFPPAKINLGLHIAGKRPDGYHKISSCLYPISWCDKICMEEAAVFSFSCNRDELAPRNVCRKAFLMLQQDFGISGARIHLEKRIPVAAGLGGGSSDAAACLLGLQQLFDLPLTQERLYRYARLLGSDCSFFLEKKAMIASGRGDILKPVDLNLEGCYLLVVYPNEGSSTATAYARLKPEHMNPSSVEKVLAMPLEHWRTHLHNDFERVVFAEKPLWGRIKEDLYDAGAWYASLSGSGSALYGLFKDIPPKKCFANYEVWAERL